MSTKTEERIKKLLDAQLESHMSITNERVSGIFMYGFIAGVIMSYSGFLAYFAGIGTGIIISKKYKYFSYQITEKASYIFQNVINRVNS
jgi:hypothetical protein